MVGEAILSFRKDFKSYRLHKGLKSLLHCYCLAKLENETYLLTELEFIMRKE